MAKFNGTANSVPELVQGLVGFLTDPAAFGAGNEWKLVTPASTAEITETSEIILQGVGDGQDTIYVGLKIVPSATTDQVDIVLNGFAGYDAGLTWREQPGGIYHQKLPIIPLVRNTFMTFWVSATTSRFIIIVELSTNYEGAYMGLIKPVAVERQYPYPLLIGGGYIEGGAWTNLSPGHSLFVNPGSDTFAGNAFGANIVETEAENTSSLRLRRPDGSWRAAINRSSGDKATHFEHLCVWPTNTEPVQTLTVYDPVLTLENVILYPFLLYESAPVGLIGQMDGIYWVGNREDLSAKDSIVYQDKTHKVFSNVFRRGNDSYFAIEWF